MTAAECRVPIERAEAIAKTPAAGPSDRPDQNFSASFARAAGSRVRIDAFRSSRFCGAWM